MHSGEPKDHEVCAQDDTVPQDDTFWALSRLLSMHAPSARVGAVREPPLQPDAKIETSGWRRRAALWHVSAPLTLKRRIHADN